MMTSELDIELPASLKSRNPAPPEQSQWQLLPPCHARLILDQGGVTTLMTQIPHFSPAYPLAISVKKRFLNLGV